MLPEFLNFDFLMPVVTFLTSAIPPIWWLALLLLPSLATCFFGYYVWRVLLPIYGFIIGYAVGQWLGVYVMLQFGVAAQYVMGIFIGVVLVLGACFLFRLFFSLFLALTGVMGTLLQYESHSPFLIITVAIIGLLAALFWYHFASFLIRILSAIGGAFGIIVLLLQLFGWIETPDEVWQIGILPIAGVVTVTAILTIMGCYVQFSVPRWIARWRQAKARAAARLLGPSRLTIGQAAPNTHPPE